MPATIFCPRCQTLLLEAQQCPKCGWVRPTRPPGQDDRLQWESKFPEGISSGLTYAEGVLFFVDGQSRLHAIAASDGRDIWESPVDLGKWHVHNQVAVHNGMVIVGPTDASPLPEYDKAVLAIDAASGQERWRRPLHERQISDPLIIDDRVFVAVSSGQAMALRLENGVVLWKATIGGLFMAAPAAQAGLVFFGGDKGMLTALDYNNGAIVWSYHVGPFGSWPESIPYTPAVVNGTLYFTCWNRKAYALDASSGAVKWVSEPTKKRPPMTAPLVTDGALYFAAHDRYVYALDKETGQLLWQTQLPRRSEVLPLYLENTLYVAGRDHHIYALDAGTGKVQEAPILTTGGKVNKIWAFDGTTLYLADDLGKVYAIQLVQLNETEKNPQALMHDGRWEEAAVVWALQGQYIRAAEIYERQLAKPVQTAQLYEKGGDNLRAAAQYEAGGDLKRALELYRNAAEWDKVASLSEQQGDILGAAQAYERIGHMAKAGYCYHQLGKYAQSVSMYEQAAEQAMENGNQEDARQYLDWAVKMYRDQLKQPVKAVMLLDQFEQTDAARELLQTILGWKDEPLAKKLFNKLFLSPLDRAKFYEKKGDFLLAAKEYQKGGEHLKAADIFAGQHEFVLAAKEYVAAKMPVKAAEMMEEMGNWDEAGDLYLQAKRPDQALQAYLKAGDARNAAALFEQLGNFGDAAKQWEILGLWEQAAINWEKVKAFGPAAQAWIKEGDSLLAAENYLHAAEQNQIADSADAEKTAQYYELAMQAYEACGVQNKAELSDKRRRQCRKQPFVTIDAVRENDTLQINEWGKLDVVISNQGWGEARNIHFKVSADRFDLDTTKLAGSKGLVNGYQSRYTLWLKPKEAGWAVPLHLTISYADRKDNLMPELIYDTGITVHRQGSQTRMTPQQFIVQGDYIQADQVQKQVGDRVNIKRTSRNNTLGSASEISVTSSNQDNHDHSTPMITCPRCGIEQPATNPRCANPRCGEPFFQCPRCSLYQPYDEGQKFCVHCGAPL